MSISIKKTKMRDLWEKDVYWVEAKTKEEIRQRLRISITDGCNFNCFFCHNEGQGRVSNSTGYMSVQEITKIIEIAVKSGIKHVKVTGGEPLLYRKNRDNIVTLIQAINALRDSNFDFSLSLVTNGYLLSKYAKSLKQAGLDRVTISLTTLNPVLFNEYISKGSSTAITKILDGIATAVNVGLKPIKVNTVVFYDKKKNKGNLEEISTIIKKCKELRVDELRLYTLLWHKNFEDFENYYCYWDDERVLFNLLECKNLQNGNKIKKAVLKSLQEFSKNWASLVYPQPRMVINCDGLPIAFEPMKHKRFAFSRCGDEGPYAIRISSRGEIQPCLLNEEPIQFLQLLRNGASDATLISYFEKGFSLMEQIKKGNRHE